MKICPGCGLENSDIESVCSSCFTSLSDVKSEELGKRTAEFFKRVERKEKIVNIVHLALIPLYYIIYIPFYIGCFKVKEVAVSLFLPLLFPLLYYLSLFKTEAMFRFQHMFDIDNLDDVEISDWYYTSSKIGGYLILALGLFMIIYAYVSLNTPSGVTVNVEPIVIP